ncbi:hypothetical protein CFP56_020922 [Quercus suber]|uniref:Secreted protein n=1 Tax=Quercus suber TaxID=58331 RepID=A0AAW0M003_QUESU
MSCNYIRKVTVKSFMLILARTVFALSHIHCISSLNFCSTRQRCSVVLRFLDTNCVNVAASDNSMQTKCNKHTACGWIWAHKDFEILEMVVDVKI